MSDKDRNKLASSDKALLRAVASGEGVVVVTPDLLEELRTSLEARETDIATRFPALVKECPYETRLAVTAWVMEQIVTHAKDGGTFRYLIYERLGFNPDAYVPLYLAGGMTISNEFDLSESEVLGSQPDGSKSTAGAD